MANVDSRQKRKRVHLCKRSCKRKCNFPGQPDNGKCNRERGNDDVLCVSSGNEVHSTGAPLDSGPTLEPLSPYFPALKANVDSMLECKRKRRRKRKRKPVNVLLTSSQEQIECKRNQHVHLQPMISKATHVYKGSGNCSKRTRHMDTVARKEAHRRVRYKVQRHRRLRDEHIMSLPLPATATQRIRDATTQFIERTMNNQKVVIRVGGKHIAGWTQDGIYRNHAFVSGRKIYIAGISKELMPELPLGSIAWSVHDPTFKLHCDVRGGHLEGVFTLLPRWWIKQEFPDTNVFYDLLMKLLQKNRTLKSRGKSKTPVFEGGTVPSAYVNIGPSAKRNGKGIVKASRKMTETDKQLLEMFFRKVSHAAHGYMDSVTIKYGETVKALLKKYGGFSFDQKHAAIWTNIAFVANGSMPIHIDDDFYIGCVTALGANGYHNKQEDDALQYFCFPSHGVSVGLRNGDILLFNPQIYHCASSRATTTENVILASFYLKTAIVGGNNNDKPVGEMSL
jgi:hypothetical protein